MLRKRRKDEKKNSKPNLRRYKTKLFTGARSTKYQKLTVIANFGIKKQNHQPKKNIRLHSNK